MYKIRLERQAKKFLEKIPIKHAKQIVEKIHILAENSQKIEIKTLKGFPKYKRIKSGEYRIIFRIQDDVLLINIVLIGKRNDSEIYKQFKKLLGN